jgi:hypothetical protein
MTATYLVNQWEKSPSRTRKNDSIERSTDTLSTERNLKKEEDTFNKIRTAFLFALQKRIDSNTENTLGLKVLFKAT